jgi:hypothetical protein
MMTIVKFMGVYFAAGIGAALFLGRFMRAASRATPSVRDEPMARSLFQLDRAIRSAETSTSSGTDEAKASTTKIAECVTVSDQAQ